MSRIISMQVEAMDDQCKHCRKLEVDNDVTDIYAEYGTPIAFIQRIYCKNISICETLKANHVKLPYDYSDPMLTHQKHRP